MIHQYQVHTVWYLHLCLCSGLREVSSRRRWRAGRLALSLEASFAQQHLSSVQTFRILNVSTFASRSGLPIARLQPAQLLLTLQPLSQLQPLAQLQPLSQLMLQPLAQLLAQLMLQPLQPLAPRILSVRANFDDRVHTSRCPHQLHCDQ